jgi:hypothetical protein
LPPFATAVWDLVFEEFEGVEAELMLWYLEGFLEDVGGLVLHKE